MIIKNNIEALRVKCEDVNESEVGHLVDLLEKELYNSERLGNPGIGLAAPQIGIAKKIAIVRLGNYKIDLVNANIEKAYNKIMFKDEGCLSFPGRIETTMRYQEIVVNNFIYPQSFICTGLLAVVCQHELDHLNGILLPDLSIKENKKLKPNDFCYCGKIDEITGKIKKYKKCCGKVLK